jgi:hypothetical protein
MGGWDWVDDGLIIRHVEGILRMAIRKYLLVLISTSLLGCLDDPARPPEPILHFDIVPALAPNYTPPEMYGEPNIIENTPYITGGYLKNILTVFFTQGATQQERQAAVDKVSGTVVGGVRFGSDGVYYVQVASDSTGALLAAAKDSLNALPQVGIALYELFLENVADYRNRMTAAFINQLVGMRRVHRVAH